MHQIELVNTIILIAAILVLVGIFSSLVAKRFGAPLLLVFLVLGMLAGEDGPGGLVFNDYQATYLVGSSALAVILFDGGLRTRLSAFRGALAPSLMLSTVGVVATAALVGGSAWFLLDGLPPLEALLLGAIVASTDAAAVFFLLRAGGLQLQPRVGYLLEIESGTNDPMAVFLTIVLTELLLAGVDTPTLSVAGQLVQQMVLGIGFGLIGGFSAAWLLNRVEMTVGLHPLFVVAGAILIYALTALLNGSGLLAVYIAGLVLANRPVRAYPSIVGFHDAATWFCQIVMFLVLGLLATPSTLWQYALPGIAIALFLTFVARPAAVWLCLSPFGFTGREKLFVSWVGLRGAVSIFLAAIPMMTGVPSAEAFFNIAFFVVLVSLLVQGWTLNLAARRLGMALRRTAPSVSRLELDIPGQVEQEMVGYPILPESLILGLSKLPTWARPVLVVRDKEILDAAAAGGLQAGDYVYLLTPRERVPRLDRLFAESRDMSRRTEPLFGELSINGDACMGDVAALYGIEMAEEERAHAVSEFFEAHLRASPQPGHRLPVGRAMLIVRSVENGRVTRAGLQLEELIDALVATAVNRPHLLRLTSLPGRQWLRRIRKRA
ncbi:MAG: potassium/proton antiporter [Alphaproteobacteria bacterium]